MWKNVVLMKLIFVGLMVVVGLTTMFMSNTFIECVIGMTLAILATAREYKLYGYYIGFPKC